MKVSAVVAFASLMAATLNGANVWVDGRMPDYSGHDGSTEALAFETIQEAVAAASAGDTVKVKPGVYDSGATALPSDDGGNLVRVMVDKKLRIESTDGAAATHIVGAEDPDGKETNAAARRYGLGDKAVRCVSVLEAGAGTVIKGFTIRGGRSRYDGNANQASTHAGGIKGAGQDTYVVDCVVSNCVATRGGAARDITAVRTLFQGNIAVNNGGSTTRFSRHYACLFINNGLEHSAVSLSAISDASAVVNCSLVGNGHGSISIEGNVATKVHNTLTILNRLDYPSISISGNISKSPDLSHVICDKCANDATGATQPTMTKVSTVLGQDHKTLVSPFDGDWRPVRYGVCDGTGDPALASPSWVPEEFRGFDFHGQPLVRANGTVNVGAVSAVGDADGGVMFFSSSTTYAVDGYAKSLTTGAPMYVRAGNGPKQVCVRVVDTLFCMSQSGAWTWSRFPDANNEIWMTLPPPGDVVTNVAISATATLYVDPKGSDANDGSSPTAGANNVGPKKTLAKAVAAASAESSKLTIIRAAAGMYDEGTIAACGWTNRVYLDRNVFLRGAGADKTTIKGHYDGSDPSDRGCGPTAVRCVCAVNSSSYQTCVSGFTLADGCVNGGSKAGNSDPYKGGAFYINDCGWRGQLIDCVITNCSGSRGGVVFGGWLQRCLVTGCGPIGNLSDKRGSESLRKLCMSSCVVRDNNANCGGYFIVANDTCLLVNNTFIGNGTHTGYGDIADSVTMALNCVTVDKELKPISSGYGLNNFQNSSNAENNGYVYAADLRLVDKASRDLRPCADSPLVGGGTVGDSKVVSSRTTAQWFSILSINDFDGNPMCFVDGKPVAGAYQKPLPVVSVEAKLAGDLSPVGVTPWADGGTVTVTATGDAKRHFLGFSVDGELVPAVGRSYTYTMAPGFYRPTPVVISAVYSSDWYVNADKGNDANDGWTPETPKRTLIAAMQGPVAGDTVHAAAGEYNDGTVADGSGSTTKCRVNVPAGVTLRGDDRDGTIIEGKRGTVNATSSGLGDDAVRGVYLNANAKLCNLTVRKGYTKNGSNSAESRGAGVLGASRAACFVEDCTICDCYGSRSGGGHSVTFNRCRLLNNYGDSTGAAGRGCSYYNTYISGCKGNYRPMQESTAFINCTYANDATDSEFVDPFQGANVTVANSVFLCDKVQLKSNVVSLKNVVFLQGGGVAMNVPTVANVTTNTAEEIALDDNGCPRPGSVLIDAGDDAQLGIIGDLDCDGGQRVYNGTIDIGCCERDWRGRYGADVGATVTAATPEVVERKIDGADRVFLPAGEIGVAWGLGVGVSGRITAQVTGNGVLEMYVGDDEEPTHWWTAGSPELFKWRSTVADANLRFRYLPGEGDTGGAYVKSFETRGMTLIVR